MEPFGSRNISNQKGKNYFGSRNPDHAPATLGFSEMLHQFGRSSNNTGVGDVDFSGEDVEMTQDVVDAKLARNKAEIEAVASSMKTEMANFRTYYVESFAEQSKALNRIESKAEATEKRLTQAQWVVSLVISVCAVTLSAVIFFSNKSAYKPAQQQPSVVVNAVQPSNTPLPLNQK